MRANPLLYKEFRQRMRARRTPLVVAGYFVSMAALTFFLLYENVQGQLVFVLPARSEQVFLLLSLLQMTVVAFLTPAFAAGAISGERERRTLAVLLTTPLSPIGILVGKVLSSSALLALLLVVTLPLYSLVFLFGGAVPQEVLAVFGFQMLNIILIAALSVLWSTIALRSGWSTVLSYATVGFMVIFTGVVGYGLRLLAQSPMEFFAMQWSNELLGLNPLWIEASLAGVVTTVSHAWLRFLGFYAALVVVLAIPAVFRLRPQLWRFLPGDERNYQ
ncbi:ABC transporter permease [Alicyclobacillus herbarius]|uniref:ABC transporter permease n=1 Tax=Alicyclobacillus herbarius TaxID=122960 RepID=UPI00047E2F61|nr:ABC transporter permease [Alicyclobacillus herbarius]